MSQPLLFVLSCAFVLTIWGLQQYRRYRRNRRMWDTIQPVLRADAERLGRLARQQLARVEAVHAARQRAKVPR